MTKAAWLVTAAFVSTSFGCTVETDRPTAGNESTPRLDSSESKMPARCDSKPVARARADVKGVAFARGDGPVFVGLGTSNVVRYTEDTKQHAGWYYYKTLWAIAP